MTDADLNMRAARASVSQSVRASFSDEKTPHVTEVKGGIYEVEEGAVAEYDSTGNPLEFAEKVDLKCAMSFCHSLGRSH